MVFTYREPFHRWSGHGPILPSGCVLVESDCVSNPSRNPFPSIHSCQEWGELGRKEPRVGQGGVFFIQWGAIYLIERGIHGTRWARFWGWKTERVPPSLCMTARYAAVDPSHSLWDMTRTLPGPAPPSLGSVRQESPYSQHIRDSRDVS
jgi:hypothetical protein